MADKVMERSLQTQGFRKPCYDNTGHGSVCMSERIGIKREVHVCCVVIEESYSGGLCS